MSASSLAMMLKEEGNKSFADGDFLQAELLYTQAIQKDPRNPKFFTNRAMARIRLESWDPSIDDCIKAIELDRNNMKGFFFLAQAQLGLKHPNEALASALKAYEMCIETSNSNAAAVSKIVLTAKKEKWAAKERDRMRQRSQMLRELEDSLILRKEREIWELNIQGFGPNAAAEEKVAIEKASDEKINELRSMFAISDPENLARREVPDYLIDGISFNIMHDPVVTKTGNSYDRSTLIEHLKRSQTDPLTREPLSIADLRPNLALKQACTDFLTGNGWAVDW